MISAVLLCLDHIREQNRQIQRIGRRADLVVYYAELRVGRADAEHGLDKVVAVHAEDPGDADNEILVKLLPHRFLAVELGHAVDILRVEIAAVRLPGRRALSGEDIVGADVHHLRIDFAAGRRKVFGAEPVDFLYQLALVSIFRGIHSRPGRAVNQHVRLHFAHHAFHRRAIRDVERHIAASRDRRSVLHTAVCRRKIGADYLFAATQQFIHDIVAQLTRDAGHQGAHQRRSPYIFSKYFRYSPLTMCSHQSR